MYVIMQPRCSREDLNRVLGVLSDMGALGCASEGDRGCTIEVLEGNDRVDQSRIEQLHAVIGVGNEASDVLRICNASARKAADIPLGASFRFGGRRIGVIAGPCSVEDRARLLQTARAVAAAGAVGLRGGAFKPRTAPYSFQGLGDAALEMLAEAGAETGLAIVTEVMTIEQIERVAVVADVLQIGSRNMHNTPLLRAAGEQSKPVLLKRGWSATLEEFLLAAEYVRQAGNPNVILCERGIRTFEDYVRNTLALAVVPEAQQRSGLPVIVDPSHGVGRAHLVAPMCRAAVACGADGLLIEVHPEPDRAWSDRAQALNLHEFSTMMRQLERVAAACDREL